VCPGLACVTREPKTDEESIPRARRANGLWEGPPMSTESAGRPRSVAFLCPRMLCTRRWGQPPLLFPGGPMRPSIRSLGRLRAREGGEPNSCQAEWLSKDRSLRQRGLFCKHPPVQPNLSPDCVVEPIDPKHPLPAVPW
jgi:hypothetical protein